VALTHFPNTAKGQRRRAADQTKALKSTADLMADFVTQSLFPITVHPDPMCQQRYAPSPSGAPPVAPPQWHRARRPAGQQATAPQVHLPPALRWPPACVARGQMVRSPQAPFPGPRHAARLRCALRAAAAPKPVALLAEQAPAVPRRSPTVELWDTAPGAFEEKGEQSDPPTGGSMLGPH